MTSKYLQLPTEKVMLIYYNCKVISLGESQTVYVWNCKQVICTRVTPLQQFSYWTSQGGAFCGYGFVICVLCLSLILSYLFLAALRSPARKRLTSWLSRIWRLLVFLSLFHMMSLVQCGTWFIDFWSLLTSLLCCGLLTFYIIFQISLSETLSEYILI